MVTAFYSDSGEKADAYRLLAYAYEKLHAAPMPEIAKTPEGKPYFPSRPGVFISVSHTPGRVMVCLGEAPCGCDTQILKNVPDRVASRVCAEAELAEFGFFELWTLKESLIKLTGRFIPYKDMVFRRDGADILPPSPGVRARLYPADTHMSALCAKTDPPDRLIYVPVRNLI